MKRLVPAVAALSLALPAAAQNTPLSLEQMLLLRCSAAFAVTAGEQQRGGAAQYPPLAERGREYFVRASARLMDELHLDRTQVEARLRGEVAAQQQARARAADPAAYVDSVVQPCLVALDASGL